MCSLSSCCIYHGSSISLYDPAFHYPPIPLLLTPRYIGQSNTPEHFSWLASIPLLYHAHHHFHFTPSPEDPNITIFNQEETFSGLLARLLRSDNPTSSVGKGIMKNCDKLNHDLKLRSEAVYAE
jgi:hypothetical protein